MISVTPPRGCRAQDLGQRDGLGRIQAAGDLVQQQHARLGGQRPRQLHALLAGHVQLGGPDAGAVRQPHQLQHLHRFAARVRQPGMTQQQAPTMAFSSTVIWPKLRGI